jgi:hypothetical protein
MLEPAASAVGEIATELRATATAIILLLNVTPFMMGLLRVK